MLFINITDLHLAISMNNKRLFAKCVGSVIFINS